MTELIRRAFEENGGIMRLLPAWVPRVFCRPGMRIKLHPNDTYALGLERGGIDERWFSSTTHAENGPLTAWDEGLSYVAVGDGKVLLRDVVAQYGSEAIGTALWKQYGAWPIYSKFFDNLGPLPHHVHHNDAFAKRVGQSGKPEMYFFPAQHNNYGGEFPHTYFGLNPGTRRAQFVDALKAFSKGDNRLLSLARAYTLELDTGWDVPPGVLHAPGSLCTYEPQFASDVFAMYQSVLLGGHVVSEDLLWKDSPPEARGDFEYLADVLDWELNTDPMFFENRRMTPVDENPSAVISETGFIQEWICYKCETVSAKRLTILPGREAVIADPAAYGLIMVQGTGKLNDLPLETPTLIRYGEQTYDEYFISVNAANDGVRIRNLSGSEPLVMLKHFAGRPGYEERAS